MRGEVTSVRARAAKSPYSIRAVDGDEYADDIDRLHDETKLHRCKYDGVHWWLTFYDGHPVGYCGLMQSWISPGAAYLVRVGVLKEHRGNSLQYRMMRVAETFARRQGWSEIISDTTDNPPSANNFIRSGYKTFEPTWIWAFEHSVYWRKVF